MTLPTGGDARTFAVVSAYHPPEDLGARCRDLLDQVEGVVVVDDGSDSVRKLDLSDERVVPLILPQNVGIAGALNAGIELAVTAGATHILTLDQDSVVPSGYVPAMHAALRSITASAGGVAGVVPAIVEGELVSTIGNGIVPLDPIQSGQVLVVDAIKRVGPFDERFVIDAVDSEYTLRVRAKGYELFVVQGAELGHSLGELEPLLVFGRHRPVLGRPRYWRYHAPFRTYYMVRNGLALWRLHRRGNISWLLRRTAYLAVDVTYTSLASPDRRRQFLAVAHALRDTLRRRWGRIPQGTVRAIAQTASPPRDPELKR